MTMDPSNADRDVIDDVRIACERSGRPTDEAEIRRAMADLSEEELESLGRIARSPLAARPLGPSALVDIVRGTPPMKAAAREVAGYYELKAERDVLATIASSGTAPAAAPPSAMAEEEEEEDEEEEAPPPPDAFAETERRPRRAAPASPAEAQTLDQRRQALMTLFAYHRDAVRVAQELNISLHELNEQIEDLGLKRPIHKLLEQTTDIEAFSPDRLAVPKSGPATPVVRRRTEARPAAQAAAPQEPHVDTGPSVPAAQTEPVNVHGTRVYRRGPPPRSPVDPAALQQGLGTRREYVRETRRGAKRVHAAVPAVPEAKPAQAPKGPAKRPFSELQSSGGRAILEKLLADEKANPRVLAAKLGERFDGAAERGLNESDLRTLLQYHGLADTFREREIVNTRFLIGFHQGARGKLANALQMSPEELSAYLSKLGLADELEKTRSERSRIELGRRKINDRIVQVLTRAPYLDDLGVLGVIDREVREHLDYLFEQHTGADADEQVRTVLGIEKNAFTKLLRRYGMGGDAPAAPAKS